MTSVFAIEFDHSAHEGLLAPEIADQAMQMVPTVFIIIIGTVFLYGLSARRLALSLGSLPLPRTESSLPVLTSGYVRSHLLSRKMAIR